MSDPTPASPRAIALVGHCGPDLMLLRQAVRRAAPDSDAVAVNDDAGLRDALDRGAALLVNRVLDGRFEHGDGGIDLLRSVLDARPDLPAALVSNFPEAQAEAAAVGARPGFGKSGVHGPDAAAVIASLGAG